MVKTWEFLPWFSFERIKIMCLNTFVYGYFLWPHSTSLSSYLCCRFLLPGTSLEILSSWRLMMLKWFLLTPYPCISIMTVFDHFFFCSLSFTHCICQHHYRYLVYPRLSVCMLHVRGSFHCFLSWSQLAILKLSSQSWRMNTLISPQLPGGVYWQVWLLDSMFLIVFISLWSF